MLGEEVVIAKRGRPVAKVIPIRPAKRKPGTGKGQILYMSEEFDSPLDDFAAYTKPKGKVRGPRAVR